jgi:hypothetical protein
MGDAEAGGIVSISAGADGIDGGLPTVAHQLKAAGITIERLTLERGRLDDVFRILTLETQGEAKP